MLEKPTKVSEQATKDAKQPTTDAVKRTENGDFGWFFDEKRLKTFKTIKTELYD